ncbi:N-6 DNA methylase [Bradyrhizobium sp. HKCCYLRH1030]|uniref:N-6 DNA methylase n=1 Tax=Bradyrhizobium sp. HKCCYLRH1030 TaxID=3420744 RepID=UPI003EBFA777
MSSDRALQESAWHIADELFVGGLSKQLIRETFATFLLLRWIDLAEAEQEAMAIFEDRPYEPLLPAALQWRHWAQLKHRGEMIERLHELERRAEALQGDAAQPMSAWLHTLAAPLRRVLQENSANLQEFVNRIGNFPFETPSERRALLEVFDRMAEEDSDPSYGQFSSPRSIARLVAALSDPKPGERVYDPCFGSGNFLVAAWQQAEFSRSEIRRSGPLLEVAGIELNASAFLIGLVRMLLAGVDTPSLERGNSLEREQPGSLSRQGFDVVLANPPIGVRTNREPWRYQQYAIPTSDSVGLFIQHALLQLKPLGRAVIAVPEGFLFRGGPERELRRYLIERGQVEAVVGLPAGAFAPYTNVKGSLLVLNKSGGASRVRMVDAAPFFEQRSGRKAPVLRNVMAQQLAAEVRRTELRKSRELPPGIAEGAPGTGVMARSVWEVDATELAAADWDLSPRRREKGSLGDLLISIEGAFGETGSVVTLASVAEITAGRSIKSADLWNEPPNEHPVGYIRIRDLNQGKVGNCSSWLAPDLAAVEQRFTLLPGDILLSKSGTIGKVAMVRNGAVGSIAANGLYVLRADQKRLDPGFLIAYLASTACQTWLTAQARGAVIQHLNREVLNVLPVPLPPLQLQARAAAQFRDFGTDALTFLQQATGAGRSDRLANWLAELSSLTASSTQATAPTVGTDATQLLSQFDALGAMAGDARRWAEQEQDASQSAKWLVPLIEALSPFSGIVHIPAGPGLLAVLQKAERGVWDVLELATGNLPYESQARGVAEQLSVLLRATIKFLADASNIRLRAAPEILTAGSFAEFAIELENEGTLPLRDFVIDAAPEWGSGKTPYLAERGRFSLNLRGDVPKQGDQLALRLSWSARNLLEQTVKGVVELAIRIVSRESIAPTTAADLGGSPYVTGSPLEPRHGHEVFFGRDDVIGQISRQIATHGNVVLLEGNRRAGKTSILKHLEGRKAIPGWMAIYASLQGAEGATEAVGIPTPEVFREIARSIATGLTKLGMDVPLPNGQVIRAGKAVLGTARACRDGIGDEAPFADFREYLELLLSTLEPLGLGLLLMLDEFDKLQEGIDNGVTSPQVPENIRFLIQTYPNFSAILTGSRRLKRLREEYWSALYGLGISVQVTALDMQSARSVVTEPVRGKLTYSPEAIERVVELTARQPYLMQCLCNKVFDYAVQTKSRSITVGIVNDAANNLVRDNEHFASLWDYAGAGPTLGRRRRQLVLLLCAQNAKQGTHVNFGTLQEQLAQLGVDVDDEALDADLAYLRELELVDFSGATGDGRYHMTIPLMADWIGQQQDANVIASRARTEAEEENA